MDSGQKIVAIDLIGFNNKIQIYQIAVIVHRLFLLYSPFPIDLTPGSINILRFSLDVVSICQKVFNDILVRENRECQLNVPTYGTSG